MSEIQQESSENLARRRRLTVKNFSVIEDGTLNFGKITVLIGPQSSGKSLLCKLAYFLGKELVELAVASIVGGVPWRAYLESASKELCSRFHLNGSVSALTVVNFISNDYSVFLSWGSDPNLPQFEFSPAFRQQYDALLSRETLSVPSASGAFVPGGISSFVRQEDVWVEMNRILASPADKNVLDGVVYIPAARVLFTNTTRIFAALSNPAIDSITREFSRQIQWDTQWRLGTLTTGRGVTDEINRAMTEIAKGFVMMDSGVPRFIAEDGRKLPLESLSTGVQELLPLFNVLEQLMYFREHQVVSFHATYDPVREKPAGSRPFIYLEEPEANVFPSSQNDLVRLFAWLASDRVLDFSWVITTHSPYIMTAFNTLIEAGRVGSMAGNHEKVSSFIPERYWIKESVFKAYAIEDRKLVSIFKPEAEDPEGEGMINGDYLDGVSDQLGKEFTRLLDIEFAK